MSKNVNFEIGTIVTDTFLDGVQELLTGTFNNLSLGAGPSSQTLSLNLAGDSVYDKLGTINIAGKYCHIDQQKVSGTTTGTGTRSIWLSTTENGSVKEPSFNFTVDASSPVESYVRKIGEVDASSGVLSNAKLMNGVQADSSQYNSFVFRSVLDTVSETLLTLDGQSTQVSSAGTYDSSPSANPTKTLVVSQSGTEKLYLDTAGRIVFDGNVALQKSVHGSSSILTTNKEFSSHIAGSDQPSFSTRAIDTDNNNRLTITNTGTINWGSGLAASDVYIYRSEPNTLSLGSGDRIQQATSPSDGNDLVNKTYVDGLTASLDSSSRRFSFFITS